MNELLFLSLAVLDLGMVLIAWHIGREWLLATIIVNLLLVSIFGQKFVTTFSLTSNATNIPYAAIFPAIDLLTEHKGRKAAYTAVWIGFFTLIFFLMLSQFTLWLESAPETIGIANEMNQLYNLVPTIAISSLAAYIVAQFSNVWLFEWIKRKTHGKHLWLRNNVSTMIAQLLDSFIFFTLAFIGNIPLSSLMEIMFAGLALKCLIAILDTPILYLSHWMSSDASSAPSAQPS